MTPNSSALQITLQTEVILGERNKFQLILNDLSDEISALSTELENRGFLEIPEMAKTQLRGKFLPYWCSARVFTARGAAFRAHKFFS